MCTRIHFLAAFIIPFVAGTALAQGASTITVIPVKHSTPAEIVSIIDQVYKDGPTVTAEALPKLGAVAIRADAKTTQEIRKLVEEVDRANVVAPIPDPASRPGAILILPNGRGQSALLEVLRLIRSAKKGSPECILAGTGAGDAYVNAAGSFGSFAPGAFETSANGFGGFVGGFGPGGFVTGGGGFGPRQMPPHIQTLGGVAAQQMAR